MNFVLVGQPNSGKSTIFNGVVGYKSITANFPGVTVSYTEGEVCCGEEQVPVMDIPGTYSLQATDEAEMEAVRYIYNLPDDTVIINIIDASVLSRSLELTLQLMELGRPMVTVLNMMDEADKKGTIISPEKLGGVLGVPVVTSVGRKGEGVADIFRVAYRAGMDQIVPTVIEGPREMERAVMKILKVVAGQELPWNRRFAAIKLLENDTVIRQELVKRFSGSDIKKIDEIVLSYETRTGETPDQAVSSFRHSRAFSIFEETCKVTAVHGKDIRVKVDDVLMHPVFGYVFMIGILFLSFWCIMNLAEFIDPLLTGMFDRIDGFFLSFVPQKSIVYPALKGLLEGFSGGIAIAVSFLLPFFVLLAFLEDTGYLARIAYLMDNMMHRIGLHGMSVVPLILGYGCNVPAIFATKIMKSPRDRLITAVLATLVPCSARMVVILGLLGALFSFKAALLIYLINILVMGIIGKLLSRAMPLVSPGLLMEIPKYHLPALKSLTGKTWMRLREFIFMAWPFLMAGSVVLEYINHYRISSAIDGFLAPFTSGVLGLPAAAGVVLLFGIMRKELALLLLTGALGVGTVGELVHVMTPAQVYGFTVFATFYIPCLATVAALAKVFDWKKAAIISVMTFFLAIALTVAVRVVFSIMV